MTAKACKSCGAPLPLQFGPGRRRVLCESCAPARNRGRTSAPERPKAAPVVASGLVDATKRELAEADADGSTVGQAALLLADRIEFGGERGAGLASLVKQFRECMAQALASRPEKVSDPLDELRKRRESRGA